VHYLEPVETTRPEQEPRDCGDCSLCCTLLRVDPLKKLGGVACIHQQIGSGAGCGIHTSPERPTLCGAYRCSWLLGRFALEDRPDRLGAVLDFSSNDGIPSLRIREAHAGAFDASPRLRAIAEEVRISMPVRITSADEVMDADRAYRILLPEGEEQRIRGDRIESWRGGVHQKTSRMPALERGVRRLSLAWQRWRLRGYRGADGSD
jgi:hypothetical protein